jgi:ketosteroid isomerase-like protein
MSEENVEVTRRSVNAINARDPDGFLACLHPEVVWEESGDVLPGLRGTYRGRTEARRWFEEALLEVWETFHLEAREITDASDGRVFLEAAFTARGEGSGAETELNVWSVAWFEDGTIAKRRVFWSRAEALEAAGLQE